MNDKTLNNLEILRNFYTVKKNGLMTDVELEEILHGIDKEKLKRYALEYEKTGINLH